MGAYSFEMPFQNMKLLLYLQPKQDGTKLSSTQCDIGSMSTCWFNVKTLIVDANILIFDFIKPFELFVTYLLYDNYHYVVNINFYIM